MKLERVGVGKTILLILAVLLTLTLACGGSAADLTPTRRPPTHSPTSTPAIEIIATRTVRPTPTPAPTDPVPPTLVVEPPPVTMVVPQEPGSSDYVISSEPCEATFMELLPAPPGQLPLGASRQPGDALIHQLNADWPSVNMAAFLPDGQTILTRSWGTIRLWDALTGDELVVLEDAAGFGYGPPAVSPDGRLIAAQDGEAGLFLWDAQGVRLDNTLPVTGANPTFSPDGRLLATGDWQVVTLWDAETGEKVMDLTGEIVAEAENEYSGDTMIRGHSGPVWIFAFSPDGQVLLSGGSDGTIRLWNVEDGRHLWCTGAGSIRSMSFSPDGRRILVVTPTSIRLWDAQDGRMLLDQTVPALGPASWTGIRSGVFSPDGASILTAHGDATARIWDATTGELTGLLRHPQVVNDAAYDPAGERIVTALGDHSEFFMAPPLSAAWLWLADHPDHRLAAEAQTMIDEAVAQAVTGDVDAALSILARAQALNPYPDYDLEYEGGLWAALALEPEFRDLTSNDDVDGALAILANLGRLAADVHLSAQDLARLCYEGIVAGRAADVLAACDLAVDVSVEHQMADSRSIRGTARALTGDTTGAIDDFQFYVEANAERSYLEDEVNRRLDWIARLQAGQNPFEGDVETLLRRP